MLTFLRRGLLVLAATLPLLATAAPTAREVVQNTTTELLADLKANKEQYRTDPAAFYDALNGIIGPVVDADGIARSIMTVKFAGRATPEQIARFQENFKRSLMQFYGNALLEYNNQDIRVLPGNQQSDERATVNMEIKDGKGTLYPLSYTLVSKNGEWLMRNVIINGINIGKLFRDQFAQAMKDNGNDLDKVINGWVDTVARAKQQTKAVP